MSVRSLISFHDSASFGEDIFAVNDDLVAKIPPKNAREADLVLGILFNG